MDTVASKIPKGLAEEMDQLIASGRFGNRSEILRVALREFLAAEHPATARTGRPRPDIPAFRRRLRELAKNPRYRNRWVALHEGDVVDADGDHDALVRRILDRPEEPIHIGYATENPRPIIAKVPPVVRARRS